MKIKEGKDFILSREQIIDIVLELKIPEIVSDKKIDLDKIIHKTKFGDIILN